MTDVTMIIKARNESAAALSAVKGDLEQVNKAARGVGDQLKSAGDALAGAGGRLTAGVTLPLIGVGVAALSASTDFNAAMANVASLGVPIARVNELKGAVQDMSVEFGKSTGDLSDGLYQVISAFGDSADTVEVLRINASAAAAGLATTTDAINLTSSVTKAYGDTSAGAVQQISDLAFQAVKLGQTTFPELASSMGRVAPLAASLGVSVEELFGTMATFTGVTGTASEVSTQLRGVLQSLMAPTGAMESLISDLGFASGAAMMQQLGLQGSIEAIVSAAEATGTPLQKFIGSIEGQTLALAATGGQADVFTEKLAAMGDVMGASDAAFAAQTQSINALGFQWSQLMMRVGVFAQRIGDALVPAALTLLAALEPLIDQAESLLGVFESLDPTTQAIGIGIAAVAALAGPALLALGTAMTMIAPAIGAVGAALGMLLSPIGLVVGAVVALGAAWHFNLGGIQEITASFVSSVGETWNRLSESTVSVGDVVGELVASFEQFSASVQTVMAQIGEILAPAFERVQEAFGGVGESVGELAPHFEGLLTAVQGMGETLMPIVQALATALGVTLVVAASVGVNLISSALNRLPGIVGPIIDQVALTINTLSATMTAVAGAIAAIAAGDWAAAWESLKGIVTAFEEFVSGTWTNVTTTLGNIGAAIGEAVVNTLNDLGLSEAAATVQSMIDTLTVFGETLSSILAGETTFSITLPDWLAALLDWAWPSFPDIPTVINALMGFRWPSFPELPSILNALVAWSWPTFPAMPEWISRLLSWSWPSPPDVLGGAQAAAGNAGNWIQQQLGFGGDQLGTSYAHGGWTWVGEAGPELVRLPRGAEVVPNRQSEQMAAGGVSVTVQQMNVRSDLDIYEIAYRVRDLIERG
jgi:TP901 family phage tail tape measure protein